MLQVGIQNGAKYGNGGASCKSWRLLSACICALLLSRTSVMMLACVLFFFLFYTCSPTDAFLFWHAFLSSIVIHGGS